MTNIKHLICNCCGALMIDTPEDNMDHGTNARDEGFGTCRSCGEWQTNTFYDNLIKQVSDAMKPANKEKFLKLDRVIQENFVFSCIEKGLIHY